MAAAAASSSSSSGGGLILLSMDEDEMMMGMSSSASASATAAAAAAPGDELASLPAGSIITTMPTTCVNHQHQHQQHHPLAVVNEAGYNDDSSDDAFQDNNVITDAVPPPPPALTRYGEEVQRPGAVHVPFRAPFISNNQHQHHQWRQRMTADLRAPFRRSMMMMMMQSSSSRTREGGGGGGFTASTRTTGMTAGGGGETTTTTPARRRTNTTTTISSSRRPSLFSRMVSTRWSSWVEEDPEAVGASCEPTTPTASSAQHDNDDDDDMYKGDVARGIALICVGGVILISIVVLVTLLLGGNQDSDSSSASASSSTHSSPRPPPSSPTQAPTTLLPPGLSEQEAILHLQLRNYSSNPATVFANPDSPQSLAIAWLAAAAQSNDYNYYNNITNMAMDEDDHAATAYYYDELEVRYALAVFYFATSSRTQNEVDTMADDNDPGGGEPSSSPASWTNDWNFLTPTVSVCEWNGINNSGGSGGGSAQQGVFCNEQGKVVQLILDEPNNLQGSIPEEIKLLAKDLQVVKISHQVRSGDQEGLQQIHHISHLGSLTNLQILDLSHNQIGGGIPSVIAPGAGGSKNHLIRLQELYLNDNQFVGQLLIPDEMEEEEEEQAAAAAAAATHMRILHLHNNRMFGSANPGVYAMTNLEELRMEGNQRSDLDRLSTYQEFWLLLTNLRVLTMSGVKMTTQSLRAMNRLSSLEIFHWDNGDITNTPLPDVFLGSSSSSMPNLTSLSLHGNGLTGSIPWNSFDSSSSSSSTNSKLQYLDLGSNALEGSMIPLDPSLLVNLQYLDISINDLTGTIPAPSLVALTNLQVLKLRGNSDLHVVGDLEPLCQMAQVVEPLLEINCQSSSSSSTSSTAAALNCSCCGC